VAHSTIGLYRLFKCLHFISLTKCISTAIKSTTTIIQVIMLYKKITLPYEEINELAQFTGARVFYFASLVCMLYVKLCK